jgi:hypothetical protein
MGAAVFLQEVVELAVAAVAEEEDVVVELQAVAEVKQMCALRNPPFTNYQNHSYFPLPLVRCQQRFVRQ